MASDIMIKGHPDRSARVLLFAPLNRQDSTYNGLCYTSLGALAGTRKETATWATFFPLAARGILYAPPHRLDSIYHGLCYTSCRALA